MVTPGRRRGFTLLLLLVGLMTLATAMLLDQSGRLLSLAARQRDLAKRLRTADLPGRVAPVAPAEAIPPAPLAATRSPDHWLEAPATPAPAFSGEESHDETSPEE